MRYDSPRAGPRRSVAPTAVGLTLSTATRQSVQGFRYAFRFGFEKFCDFVFKLQLSSLQFGEPDIVGSGVGPFFLYFTVESIMTTLKFGEMTLHGHSALLCIFSFKSLT